MLADTFSSSIMLTSSTLTAFLSILLVYYASPSEAGASYSLTKSYEGDSFFDTDNWSWGGNQTYDSTTNGDVLWANTSYTPALTYVNDAGNAIIKVDNSSTVAYNDKRESVKLLSKESYSVGSVWVLDAVHLPYGCSVWPAFWSYALDQTWPAGGEIDTIEGVNNQVSNQMALHTADGCSITSSSSAYSGFVNQTDCNVEVNSNAGCGITDKSSASYGADFAANGGGVWVTEFAESGISIWFFERANVPSSISSSNSTIDTNNLGTPSGYWANSGCDINKYFTAQTLAFDITLCGDWAGTSATLSTTGCAALTGTNTCYSTYVLDSANYANAYFEIKSLKVYGNGSGSSSDASHRTSRGSVISLAIGLAALLAVVW